VGVSGTVSTLALKVVVEAAARLGVDARRLLSDVQLSESLLEDRDARVPFRTEVQLWSEAARLSADPAFGLHLAEHVPIGSYDLVDYAARSSETLGEAMRHALRFHRILNDTFSIQVATEGERVHLRQVSTLRPFSRHMPEALWATWVVRGRQLTGRDWSPLGVCFPHPEPPDTSEHQRIFRCAPEFDQPVSELVIAGTVLELPVRTADSALLGLVAHYADVALARLPPAPDGVAYQVRRVLVDMLSTQEPSLDAVARKLRMNARTLQRRLRQESTSHQEILDGVRFELAKTYLDDPRASLCEVAFLLGFSEVSAFHRAFRRWTNRTPAEFRARPSPA
jgi:AraC-like DNA-binding protein